jgi:SgrR family transcriptional regulator
MQTIEYYIELRCARPEIAEWIPLQITMKELADIFCCTLRNTRSILKKLEAERLLQWKPGKGRGNPSQLTFLAPLSPLVSARFLMLVQQNNLEQALMLINHEGMPMEVRKQCYQQLRPQFGFQILERIPLENAEDPLELTMRHMVNEVKSDTSAWVINKRGMKQSIQWPKTQKFKWD